MRIDAHQHFWSLDRKDYGWLQPDMETLYRDYLPEDLEPLLVSCGVAGTVLVQAAASEEETLFLLDIAASNAFVLGVVGWVEMMSPSAPARLGALKEAGGDRLKGVRPMIQDIEDPDWILSPALDAAFEALVDLNLTFDALVKPHHLPQLAQRLSRHAGLKTVIDHGAKPDIANGSVSAWSRALAPLSENQDVFCKFSGLVTEAGDAWSEAVLKPYTDELVSLFGPSRLMWGSDWPVVNVAADYGRWCDTALSLVSSLRDREQRDVFGGNAARFYGLLAAPGAAS